MIAVIMDGGFCFLSIFSMSGHTHAIWGANMAWLAIFAGPLNESAILLVALGCAGYQVPKNIHALAGGADADKDGLSDQQELIAKGKEELKELLKRLR